ncbi:MAG: hypothetical protein PF961_03950 [Planctomycetota bacterium]|jgi:MFS family permease|nr:hypothetical protein [Planctomycetota bacterium]
MQAVDRLCAALGARAVVRDRPGMGWMLLEVIPVIVWSRITGAFSFEGAFYLVSWLLLLGAREQDLSWLPLLFYLGTCLHAVLILRRRDADGRLAEPRRTCLIDTALGRVLWLAAVLWPTVGNYFHLSTAWIVGGVLFLIFCAQVMLLAGASAWATWVRAIVPSKQRGPFFAWRNIASFVVVQITLVGLTGSALWPGADADDATKLDFYTTLFVVLSVLCLLSTWWLIKAPRIADEAELRARRVPALREAVRGRPAFWRYTAWNAANIAASACSLTFLNPLLQEAGVADQLYASWEGWARIPGVLLGILLSGALLHRLGGSRLILITNLILAAALIAMCSLGSLGLWLLPIALALDGLGRGAMSVSLLGRLHELIPHGDARFPALFMGLGGLGGVLAAALQLLVVPWLGSLDLGVSAAWCMVAFGVALRIAATPLLLGAGGTDDPEDEALLTPRV